MAGQRPRVKRESRYEYTDKSAENKKRQFTPATDEIVATFASDAASNFAKAIGDRDEATIAVLSPESNFAILNVTDGDSTDATFDSLDSTPQIANVIPVMIDEDDARRYFLPDEFTVQFADDVSEDEGKKILDELNTPVVTKQRTPGYYTVSVPEGMSLFEAIEMMSGRDEVEFAEPSEVGLDDLLEPRTKKRAQAKKNEEIHDPLVFDGPLSLADLPARPPHGFIDTDMGMEMEVEVDVDSDGAETELSSDVEALPTDTHFGTLWGLHNVGQNVGGTIGSVDADIDAPAAWNIETGKKHVIVAVIDTGADLDHPDLAANILPRSDEDWDFGDPTDDVPWDSGTHGTHVSGTVAARRNGTGVVGIAYGSWLMPLRVNLISGMNQNRADAINYVTAQAIAHKATRRYVINCSWRMSGDHTGVRSAIKKAVANNVVVVFAAGNANNNIDNTPQYPAIYPEVIAVAATDQKDQRAGFSNYGKKVDVSAPGVDIYSTIPNNTYGFKSGTSMAAPHVAGLAALLWSRSPQMSNADVRKCIEDTCDNIDAKNPGFAGLLGNGRINAYRALRCTSPTVLRTRILRSFRFPQRNAGSSSGLSFIPRFPLPWLGRRPLLLFLTQKAYSEKVYFLDPWSGAIRRTIDPVANDTIGSLSWDGSAIRVANVTTGAGSINRINPYTGSQTGSIPAPAGRGEGIVVVGGRIFYSTISHIHELRASTGQVLRSFPPPGGPCRGLAFGRGLLFSANSSSGKITVFHPWTLQVRGTIDAPGSGNAQAEGIAFDSLRRVLYIANQSENKIYSVRVYGI